MNIESFNEFINSPWITWTMLGIIITLLTYGVFLTDKAKAKREKAENPNAELTKIYFDTQGNKCPFCNSDDFCCDLINAEDLHAWRDITCYNCDITWREFFTMTEIEEL